MSEPTAASPTAVNPAAPAPALHRDAAAEERFLELARGGGRADAAAGGSLPDAVRFVSDAWHRHGTSAVLAGLLVLMLTAAYILFAPKKYVSEAQLFVRPGRESVTLDPTATTGETLSVSATRENEINSVLEILASQANLDAVVDRMTPAVVQGEEPLPEDAVLMAGKAGRHLVMKPLGPVPTDHRKAVEYLQKNLDLEVVRRSNVINASLTAASPELAQTMLSAFLDASIERHMRASRSTGTFEFFATQTEDVNGQYRDASAELADLKSKVGVVSLKDRRETLQKQYADLELAVATTKAELAEAEAAAEGFAAAMDQIPETVLTETTTGQPEDARGVAEREKSLLRIERQKLLSKYKPKHPDVQAIDDQLKEIEALVSEDEGRGQEVQATNPAWLKLETDRATAVAEQRALAGKLEAEEAQLDRSAGRLRELNRHEAAIEGLEERVKVLRETSADYTKKLEQARIDRALEAERLSNITVTQPPTYVEKAVSPKRRIAAVAGVVLAVGLGLCLMLGQEYWDRATRPVPA